MIDTEAVEKYLSVVRGMKPRTVYGIINRLRYLNSCLPILQQDSVVGLIGQLKAKYSPSYTNGLVVAWNHYIAFLNYADIPHSYKEIGTVKRKTQPAREFLSPEIMRSLAEITMPYPQKKAFEYNNKLYRFMFMFYALTGARVSELLNLKVCDVSLVDKSCWFMETKNGDPRKVILPDELLKLIEPFLTGEYVIKSFRGSRLGQQDVNIELKRRGEALGIKQNLHVHLFRHSFVSLLLQAGVDITTVARYIGHRNLNTTFSVYGHLTDTMFRDALSRHPLVQDNLSPEDVLKQDLETMKKLRIFKDKRFKVEINESDGKICVSVAVK